MSNKVVALNQQDVSVRIKMLDANGAPATGITAATAGHVIWYQRGERTAQVTDAAAANDLAAITSAHADWGFKEVGNGWYRVDFPDAAFLEGVGSVLLGMSTDAAKAVEVVVEIDPLLKFQGTPSAVTTTTTTFPAGTTPLKGDMIMVVDGTGDPSNMVMVTSVAGEVATHPAFSTGISATTSTVALIAGDATSADGGINVDAAVSTRSTLVSGDVDSAVDSAITAYDPPTKAELDSVETAILTKLLKYVQLMVRRDGAIATDNATELAAINADGGSGAGSFDNSRGLDANLVKVAGGPDLTRDGSGGQSIGE